MVPRLMIKQPGIGIFVSPLYFPLRSPSPLRMARYICHNSEWAAMATIAAREPIVGYPFANIFSVSDGPVGKIL